MTDAILNIIAAADRDDEFASRYSVGHDAAIEVVNALNAAGYVIVPKEPSEKMIDAACWKAGVPRDTKKYADIYRAMIAGAQ